MPVPKLITDQISSATQRTVPVVHNVYTKAQSTELTVTKLPTCNIIFILDTNY